MTYKNSKKTSMQRTPTLTCFVQPSQLKPVVREQYSASLKRVTHAHNTRIITSAELGKACLRLNEGASSLACSRSPQFLKKRVMKTSEATIRNPMAVNTIM